MQVHRWGFLGIAIVLMVSIAGIAYEHTTCDAKIVKKIPTTHKVVALTIDDGPHYKTTPQILEVLRQKRVKVTLFILGANADQYPELVAQAVKDGHEIANHAYSHKLLTSLTPAEYSEEMAKAEKAITAVAPKPTLFRPPGGAYNAGILAEAERRGYDTILWSIDPHDWQRPSVNAVVNTVLKEIKPGSIILLHDGQYPLPTPEAIGIIIDKLQAEGYRFVTISELLQYYDERT